MPQNRFHSSPAGDKVRAALAAADRWRRTREASRRLWRVAPLGAGLVLAAALLGKALAWPTWAPFAVLGIGGLALSLYIVISRRPHALSDAAAASIDSHAGLNGELRSASWFAGREARTDWADLHLERAAARVTTIDWAQLYPAVRAPRARAATALMILGALVLSVTLPKRVTAKPAASAATVTAAGGIRDPQTGAELLPAELLEQLEALLAAAEAGNFERVDALAQSAGLRDLLKKLAEDPEFREALARALANPENLKNFTAKEMKAMAERARRVTEIPEMSEELKKALDELADEIEIAEPEGETAAIDSDEPSASTGPQEGEKGQAKSGSGMQEMSIQFAKQADPSGGAGMMMMSNPDDKGAGPPGAGVGGAGSEEAAAAASAALAAALRQETVEASKDTPGENVDTEIRRETEHGSATTTFSRGAAANFDKSRAAAPPPVPEARRAGVQTYFVRKPK